MSDVPPRRVLVISYHFPPDGEVGGLRWAGLTKHLAQHGWRSWVLTAAASANGPSGVTVTSCPGGRTLAGLYRAVRSGVPARTAPPVAAPDASPVVAHRSALSRSLAALRAEGAGMLALFDEGHGWILRAARRARALIAHVRPDVVVSTSPPHPAHLTAWLAPRGRRVRWIVDFRDPWAGPVTKAWIAMPALRGLASRSLIGAAERLVMRSAHGVLTTTRELADALNARYPKMPVAWVPNAADSDSLPTRSAAPFPGLAIAHVGTLYGGRDLGPVLRALRVFLERCPAAARAGATLRNAGAVDAVQLAALQRDVRSLDLGGRVELHGLLPRAQALDLLARSGLAVVLAQDQDFQVPAKLYEAMAMGIPTLVVTERESATGREAVRLGAFLAEPGEVERMAGFFEECWSRRGHTPDVDPELCDYRALAPTVAALLHGDGATAWRHLGAMPLASSPIRS